VSEGPHSPARTLRSPAAPAPVVEQTFAPERVEAVATAAPEPAQALVPAQPATPVFAPPPRPRATALGPAAIAVSREEQPAVRVHIGRLEVRANLQAAPPPEQPRRGQATPEGPSLSEYLRGRSEAK
jgi:hypothetical protein